MVAGGRHPGGAAVRDRERTRGHAEPARADRAIGPGVRDRGDVRGSGNHVSPRADQPEPARRRVRGACRSDPHHAADQPDRHAGRAGLDALDLRRGSCGARPGWALWRDAGCGAPPRHRARQRRGGRSGRSRARRAGRTAAHPAGRGASARGPARSGDGQRARVANRTRGPRRGGHGRWVSESRERVHLASSPRGRGSRQPRGGRSLRRDRGAAQPGPRAGAARGARARADRDARAQDECAAGHLLQACARRAGGSADSHRDHQPGRHAGAGVCIGRDRERWSRRLPARC